MNSFAKENGTILSKKPVEKRLSYQEYKERQKEVRLDSEKYQHIAQILPGPKTPDRFIKPASAGSSTSLGPYL